MSILVASAILLIISATYSVLLKKQLAETIFLGASSIVFILFCFGLINVRGCLLWGMYLLVAGAIAGLAYLIIQFKKNPAILKEAKVLQGIILFAALLLFSLFVNVGRVLFRWDEFAHWGAFVKYLFSLDALTVYGEPGIHKVIFPHYYPGTSLFLYFFSRFSSQFVEWFLYVALNILYFSLVMPLVKDIFTKKKRLVNSIILAAFLLIPLLMDTFYASLYVDQMLGAFFGFILIYYFIYKYEKSLHGIWMVAAAAFMTTIAKDMGLLLALGALSIIFVDIVLFRRKDIKAYLCGQKSGPMKLLAILLLSLPLLITVFTNIAWSLILASNSLRSVWYRPSISDIRALISRQVEPYQVDVVNKVIYAVFNRNIAPLNFSTFTFCVLFILLVVFLAFKRRKQMAFRRMFSAALLLAVGAGVYQFVLMMLYVFSFSEREAIILASYERYTLTYICGMMLFVMIFFVSNEALDIKALFRRNPDKSFSQDRNFIVNVLGVITGVILMVALLWYARAGMERVVMVRTDKYNIQFEERATTAINKWKPYFSENYPYIIVQDDLGLLFLQIQYELNPYYGRANQGRDYYIGPEAGDIHNYMAISPAQWEEYVLANDFQLLYMYKSDASFMENYGQFFPQGVQDDMLYQVTDDDGHMLLIPIE